MKKLTDDTEYLVLETLYGLDKPANFEGKWNLHRYDAWRSVVERLSMERPEADAALASGRRKLLEARQQRIPPGLDNKVLTSFLLLLTVALVVLVLIASFLIYWFRSKRVSISSVCGNDSHNRHCSKLSYKI